MFSIGTPLSLMIDTKECRSSRGVQFSPSLAFLVIALNERRLADVFAYLIGRGLQGQRRQAHRLRVTPRLS